MQKKGILFVLTGILGLGGLTGFIYANSNNDVTEANNVKVESYLNSQDDIIKVEKEEAKGSNFEQKEMIRLMKEYGFKDMARALEKGDYRVMDEFMNNSTDEDYQKMIDIMRKSGQESMANMMESMNREDMIKMHNAMGGSAACHGD